MATYQGVVRGNRVELPEGVSIPDGAVVQVLVDDRANAGQPDSSQVPERDPLEQAVLEDMLASGLISRIPPRYTRDQATEPPPARIRGKSLAETIIEDRR